MRHVDSVQLLGAFWKKLVLLYNFVIKVIEFLQLIKIGPPFWTSSYAE